VGSSSSVRNDGQNSSKGEQKQLPDCVQKLWVSTPAPGQVECRPGSLAAARAAAGKPDGPVFGSENRKTKEILVLQTGKPPLRIAKRLTLDNTAPTPAHFGLL
jgi:hypothetical protein